MAQRSLLLSFIIIAIILSGPAIGLFPDLLQAIWNIARIKTGTAKFAREFNRFQSHELRDETPDDVQEFDFIIVGAGSAGAAVASRLSEIKSEQVLLLEAGGHETLTMDVPLFALLLQLNKDINWDYRTEPGDYCRGIQDNQCRVAKGKVMGGTSTLNFMIAVRGNKHDYDEWYRLTGDKNWSYEGMLKSFKKLETFDARQTDFDEDYHNFNGPVRIANPPSFTPLARAFISAGRELGLPPVDYNGRSQTGFSYMQTNQINGERLSSNRAYLHPVRHRKNLHLSLGSQVTRVLIDPDTRTAYGVEFVKDGCRRVVRARKEVILSAGAVATPQLLMLSGIGPADHLRSMGINLLQDAPGVGENLKDHVAYGGLYFLVNQTVGLVLPEYLIPTNPTIADYLMDRTGHLAAAGGVEALGLVNVDDLRPQNETPNIELMFASVSAVSSYFVHLPFAIKEDHFQQFLSKDLYKHAWLVWPLLMKPRSVGRILLRSRNPLVKPKIIANYYSDPEDVRVSIKGIRLAIEVSKTKAMQRYGSWFQNNTVPGCESSVPDSDDYWECALRTYTITLWHHCGTAKMGRDNDPMAVVNTRLQVKGIKRLRVADTSVMPEIVTAHTNIPAMAIGEKFADILKEDYGFVQARVY